MDHFQTIYASRAKEYHRMITVEDVDGNLIQALTNLVDWNHKAVLDLGTGTGRFPMLFKGSANKFICLDLYRAMLSENQAQRDAGGYTWGLVQGDMRCLPIPEQSFDIVIAGWAIGHLRSWFAANWKLEMEKIIHEMQRVVTPNGVIIICETMSTGSLIPKPPVPELAEYYQWLEITHGFAPEVVPTDYQFKSVEQAAEYTEFFFGPELAEDIRKNQWVRLPEWTGIWSKRIG
jgi:ubiquinone/menaquinone biosynthesis C-methylase UbiE